MTPSSDPTRGANGAFHARRAAVLLFAIFAPILAPSAWSDDVPGTEARRTSDDVALVLEFADWLNARGDGEEAEQEYLRYLFLADAADARAVSALAGLYRARGDDARLLALADRYIPSMKDSPERASLSASRGLALLHLKRWPEFDSLIASSRAYDGRYPERVAQAFAALSLSGTLYRDDIAGARESVGKIPPPDDETARDLIASIEADLAAYAPKSPALAVALSAAVPGLGRAYARQYGDAFLSFAASGALIAATALTARAEGPESWKTWAYGAAAGIAYSANLYGSYGAATRYNDARGRALKEKSNGLLARFFE